MNLDNALNLKTDILTRVLDYEQLSSVLSDDGADGVDRPAFIHSGNVDLTGSPIRSHPPELQVSVGVRAPSEQTDAGNYGANAAHLDEGNPKVPW